MGRRGRERCDPTRRSLAPPLPEYERNLDHAGIIAGLGPACSFDRGEAIYDRVCANCHGTKDQPGSLPTALGSPPGRSRTAAIPTACIGLSPTASARWPPQTWMVPRQKYDVIHYIREAYLKPRQPEPVRPRRSRRTWTGFPRGRAAGPTPSEIEPWVAMDYGRA